QSKKAINEDYKENLEIILLIDRLQKLTVDAEKIKELDYQKVSLYMEIGEKGNAQKIMQKYIPLPAFVSKSGVYPEGTLFEITVPKGKIEYTIDKDKTPIVYSGAIMLEPGSRTVRAYAVDENGIKSEVIEAYYVITADDAKTLEKN
ncbi:MAG: chitobiase/beta-hexosaminidase C-terminal domain-containing protein, partial [Oscillospiraceae bacterium]